MQLAGLELEDPMPQAALYIGALVLDRDNGVQLVGRQLVVPRLRHEAPPAVKAERLQVGVHGDRVVVGSLALNRVEELLRLRLGLLFIVHAGPLQEGHGGLLPLLPVLGSHVLPSGLGAERRVSQRLPRESVSSTPKQSTR